MRSLRRLLALAFSLFGLFPVSAAAYVGTTVRKAHAKRSCVGLASWYGKRHQGKRMTNGERFDRRSLTAASRWLPLGTRIRVFNLKNGKFVDATVTDRGPARHDRVLDLSEAAARELDFTGEGLARVFFYVLPQPETVDVEWTLPGKNPAIGQ